MKRINIMIDDETNDKLEVMAKNLSISKSAMIRILIREKLMQEDTLKTMEQAINYVNSQTK